MSISLFFSILTTFVSAQFVMISGVFISSIIKYFDCPLNRFSAAYLNLSPVKNIVEIVTTTTTTVVAVKVQKSPWTDFLTAPRMIEILEDCNTARYVQ